MLKHLIGKLERFLEGRFRLCHQKQVLVRDNDQRIDVLLQLFDAAFGGAHAARAFKQERFGHDTHRQHALATRRFGDHGRSARTGAAAHTGGDEQHVHTLKRTLKVFQCFFGSGAAHFRAGTGTKALRDIGAKLDAVFSDRIVQCLRIGIHDDKIDAFDLGIDHVGDGIATCAADADHRDPGTKFVNSRRSDVDAHCRSPNRVSHPPIMA